MMSDHYIMADFDTLSIDVMRFFNTAGPVNPEDHYCLSPFERLDLDELVLLVQQSKYFVLHAPRQTGKTSALLAFRKHLNDSDEYRCIYVNVEAARAAHEDVAGAMQAIRNELSTGARTVLEDTFVDDAWDDALARSGPYGIFGDVLSHWAKRSEKPLVVLIDNIDALVGDTLISVLRQLRSGYNWRPEHFPQSVLLCGISDVRDYRIHSNHEEKAVITGGSVFNIKAESLRLSDFSKDDVERLYRQYTEETGQAFTADAIDRVWELTQGQPGLVNALVDEVCFRLKSDRDLSQPITLDMINDAKENLIIQRESLLVQLTDKLKDERVQRVIEPILVSTDGPRNISVDDLDYVRDLGLIKQERNGAIQVANALYREIIPRELGRAIQSDMSEQAQSFVQTDGQLDMNKLLIAFQQFFHEYSEHWIKHLQYREAGPQLLLQAFLQRIVTSVLSGQNAINPGGRIEREYGLGRMRTDLLVLWPHPGGQQRIVLELKILHKSLEKTIQDGLEQTWQYLDRCGAEEAHLIIFDRSPDKSWDEKLFQRDENLNDKTIKVWGM